MEIPSKSQLSEERLTPIPYFFLGKHLNEFRPILGHLDDIMEQHRHCHRPDAAGDWTDPPGNPFDALKIDIADGFGLAIGGFDPIDPDINDQSTRADHLA